MTAHSGIADPPADPSEGAGPLGESVTGKRTHIRNAQLIVWFVILGATVLTAVLGLEQSQPSTIVGVILIAIGCIKLHLITIHFMELGNAPLGLRLAAESYFVLVLTALTTLYLTA